MRARQGKKPSLELAILRRIEYWGHVAAWLQTEDGHKNRNKPEMIPFSSDRKNSKHRDGISLDEALTRRQARRSAELAKMREG